MTPADAIFTLLDSWALTRSLALMACGIVFVLCIFVALAWWDE